MSAIPIQLAGPGYVPLRRLEAQIASGKDVVVVVVRDVDTGVTLFVLMLSPDDAATFAIDLVPACLRARLAAEGKE